MPELPEVEVTRQSFADRIEGARVRAVRLGKPLRWPLGVAPDELVGRTVGATSRRGKYLWLPLHPVAVDGRPRPSDSGGLLLHLGMSGSLAFTANGAAAPGPHDHFDLVTSAGTLRLTDPRRFGAVVWAGAHGAGPCRQAARRARHGAVRPGVHGAGAVARPEAQTGHRQDRAARRRHRRRRRQHLRLRGAARRRHRPAHARDRLSLARCERLVQALRDTLGRALESAARRCATSATPAAWSANSSCMRGSTAAQASRASSAATAVRRVVQGQRSTFFCARCQTR